MQCKIAKKQQIYETQNRDQQDPKKTLELSCKLRLEVQAESLQKHENLTVLIRNSCFSKARKLI